MGSRRHVSVCAYGPRQGVPKQVGSGFFDYPPENRADRGHASQILKGAQAPFKNSVHAGNPRIMPEPEMNSRAATTAPLRQNNFIPHVRKASKNEIVEV